MKLRNASICLDCDEVYVLAENGSRCPACASRASAPVSGWVPSLPFPGEIGIREKILGRMREGVAHLVAREVPLV